MKTIVFKYILFAFLLLSIKTQAQDFSTLGSFSIKPFLIYISTDKTTNLIFPYGVTSVDRGNKDILVQKAKGVENILQLKAGVKDFAETNLSVVLADGSLFSFILNYANEPSVLNLTLFRKEVKDGSTGILTEGKESEAKLKNLTDRALHRKPLFTRPRELKYDIGLQLQGIYIHNEYLVFQLLLENKGEVGYDIEQLRFYIRDKKIAKRTAYQEVEMVPVSSAATRLIHPHSQQKVVYLLPKFTIPDQKFLYLEIMEKNGGRHLRIKINNKKLLHAQTIL